MLPAATPPPPPIVRHYIPYPARRKQEMRAYARRHYGIDDWRLRDPKVIVEHVAVAGSTSAVFATFAPDVADVELHELPGVCSHFVVGADGSVVQMVPLSTMCRHTVGLNYTAIGIEHVGYRDADVLGNTRQMTASLPTSRRCTSSASRSRVAPSTVRRMVRMCTTGGRPSRSRRALGCSKRSPPQISSVSGPSLP